jgi:hypothetical protein
MNRLECGSPEAALLTILYKFRSGASDFFKVLDDSEDIFV